MNISEYKRKDGSVVYRFRYYDRDKKKATVPVEEYGGRPILDLDHAKQILPSLEKKFEGWKSEDNKEFYNKKLTQYYETFKAKRQKKAPNSWKDSVRYLEKYIYKYFCDEMQLYTLYEWPEYFFEFTIWLEEQTAVRTKEPLSYYSQNNCISTLNLFMDHVVEKYNLRIPYRPVDRHEIVDKISLDDIPTDEEFKLVNDRLFEHNEAYSDFHTFLRKSGLRFNEAYGIHIGMIDFDVELTSAEEYCFERSNLKPLLVINLDSQVSKLGRLKRPCTDRWNNWEEGDIRRKPLKKKKRFEDGRRVFIFDKQIERIIRKYGRKQSELHEEGVYGDSLENYGLFYDEIVVHNFRESYALAHAEESLIYKSPHKIRHRVATDYYKIMSDESVVRQIMGHSPNAAKTYNHLIEEMSKKTKRKGKPVF